MSKMSGPQSTDAFFNWIKCQAHRGPLVFFNWIKCQAHRGPLVFSDRKNVRPQGTDVFSIETILAPAQGTDGSFQ